MVCRVPAIDFQKCLNSICNKTGKTILVFKLFDDILKIQAKGNLIETKNIKVDIEKFSNIVERAVSMSKLYDLMEEDEDCIIEFSNDYVRLHQESGFSLYLQIEYESFTEPDNDFSRNTINLYGSDLERAVRVLRQLEPVSTKISNDTIIMTSNNKMYIGNNMTFAVFPFSFANIKSSFTGDLLKSLNDFVHSNKYDFIPVYTADDIYGTAKVEDNQGSIFFSLNILKTPRTLDKVNEMINLSKEVCSFPSSKIVDILKRLNAIKEVNSVSVSYGQGTCMIRSTGNSNVNVQSGVKSGETELVQNSNVLLLKSVIGVLGSTEIFVEKGERYLCLTTMNREIKVILNGTIL